MDSSGKTTSRASERAIDETELSAGPGPARSLPDRHSVRHLPTDRAAGASIRHAPGECILQHISILALSGATGRRPGATHVPTGTDRDLLQPQPWPERPPVNPVQSPRLRARTAGSRRRRGAVNATDGGTCLISVNGCKFLSVVNDSNAQTHGIYYWSAALTRLLLLPLLVLMQYLVNIAAPAVHRQSDRVDGRGERVGVLLRRKSPQSATARQRDST
jgi:hypothetical protein